MLSTAMSQPRPRSHDSVKPIKTKKRDTYNDSNIKRGRDAGKGNIGNETSE
jgi:hypothetical protein